MLHRIWGVLCIYPRWRWNKSSSFYVNIKTLERSWSKTFQNYKNPESMIVSFSMTGIPFLPWRMTRELSGNGFYTSATYHCLCFLSCLRDFNSLLSVFISFYFYTQHHHNINMAFLCKTLYCNHHLTVENPPHFVTPSESARPVRPTRCT